MKKLFTKFGSHYAIERFGFVFLTLFLCMSLLLGVIFSQKVKSDHKILTGRAVYTSSFTMSLTGVAGFVEGVYTNEDHSKCFLLWHFDDMTQLPVSVDEYMFLLKGYDLSTGIHPFTKCNPATSFYVFGNTGYMGLYFYQQSGFESQVLELTIRSLNNFPGNSGRDEAQGMSGDTSRYSYDQGIIYFNPGGSYATRVSFLDKEDWSPFDVYNEIITVPQEVSIRNLLKTELSNMHRLRLMMNEYERRLTGYGVLPSEVPVEIATDNIYATLSSVSVLDQKPGWVYLCEGVIDTLTFLGQNIAAIGIPGVRSFKTEWLPLFKNKSVVLCLDKDEAGRSGTEYLQSVFAHENIRTVVLGEGLENISSSMKEGDDINSWFGGKK